MVSCALLILGPLWIYVLPHACRGEELPREAVLSWFRERVLEDLGLQEPPPTAAKGADGDAVRHAPWRYSRTKRAPQVNRPTGLKQETSQIILFPTPDSACARADSSLGETTRSQLTFYFQPSLNSHHTLVTSAHFWFYAGKEANSSAQLFILPSGQQSRLVVEVSSTMSSDGWTTYELHQNLLAYVAGGPFMLQVRCLACQCRSNEPDKTPFLHLHARPRGHARLPRQAAVIIPWSPLAMDLLQGPSQGLPHSDCHRAEVEISFRELGWQNWIVHPKAMTFYYCHGNCSARDRTATMLGSARCCAPVPGTTKSLRVTTTSDGGYSFKSEFLSSIIPEECACT